MEGGLGPEGGHRLPSTLTPPQACIHVDSILTVSSEPTAFLVSALPPLASLLPKGAQACHPTCWAVTGWKHPLLRVWAELHPRTDLPPSQHQLQTPLPDGLTLWGSHCPAGGCQILLAEQASTGGLRTSCLWPWHPVVKGLAITIAICDHGVLWSEERRQSCPECDHSSQWPDDR